MEVSKDFEEFFASLNNHKVRYLIVGGYAVAIHGRPRYTNDIDVWLEPVLSNGQRALDALKDFGFGNVEISMDDLLDPDKVIQLGYPPLRIDLLTAIANIQFKKAWGRKVIAKYGRQRVYFIGKHDLIVSKKAAGRKRDLSDLDELEG